DCGKNAIGRIPLDATSPSQITEFPVGAELQAETMRLDDRISALRSDDRLAALAAKLNMTEPESFAVVRLPLPSNAQPQRLAEFSSLAGLVVPAP
ncbi:MAG: hypothetical protein JO277_10385, partial [Candidatus Eremiobacteraeota bacterium]|nr:hypothetical protein [Candidatus Eremiobacteraeota bacterium]